MVCLRAKSVRTCRTAPIRLVDPRGAGRIGRHRPQRRHRDPFSTGSGRLGPARRSAGRTARPHDPPPRARPRRPGCVLRPLACRAPTPTRSGSGRCGPSPPSCAASTRPPRPYGAGHRGVDLLGRAGPAGRAPRWPGTVTYAGMLAGRGVVVVSHGATRTTYEPVTASVARRAAASPRDDPIGTLELRRLALLPARLPALGLDRRGRPTSTRSGWSGRPGPAAAALAGRAGGRARGSVRSAQARGCAWRYAARSRSVVTCV